MYTAFYGLREKPFSLTPDPRYLFLSSSHREALAHLLYGVGTGGGFILLTGEVGTGKTTIMKEIARSIETNDPEVKLLVLLVDDGSVDGTAEVARALGAHDLDRKDYLWAKYRACLREYGAY